MTPWDQTNASQLPCGCWCICGSCGILPLSWQTHFCPVLAVCIHCLTAWSTTINGSPHNQMTFTDGENARHSGCQTLITWWVFFSEKFSHRCNQWLHTVFLFPVETTTHQFHGRMETPLVLSVLLYWQCYIYLWFSRSENLVLAFRLVVVPVSCTVINQVLMYEYEISFIAWKK